MSGPAGYCASVTTDAADLSLLARAALDAVAQATRVTRAVQSRLRREDRITKSDASPVTIADFAAQAVVSRVLRERLGALVLIAEESSQMIRGAEDAPVRTAIHEAARAGWPDARLDEVIDAIDLGAPAARDGDDRPRSFWTLDPIDGTKGFIRGNHYSVCLAYIHEGTPVVAALSCPNLSADLARPLDDADPHGTLFMATRDDPTTARPADEPEALGRPLAQRSAVDPRAAVTFCQSWEYSHSDTNLPARIMAVLARDGTQFREPARIDSQCKYAVVARGQADVFIRRPREAGYIDKIWDHAPGALVASRAGCVVSDLHGRPLDFGLGSGLQANQGILVSPPGMHERVLGALRELREIRL